MSAGPQSCIALVVLWSCCLHLHRKPPMCQWCSPTYCFQLCLLDWNWAFGCRNVKPVPTDHPTWRCLPRPRGDWERSKYLGTSPKPPDSRWECQWFLPSVASRQISKGTRRALGWIQFKFLCLISTHLTELCSTYLFPWIAVPIFCSHSFIKPIPTSIAK